MKYYCNVIGFKSIIFNKADTQDVTDNVKKMRALKIEPGKYPKDVYINRGVESLQKEVGGIFQAIYPYDDYVGLICNENCAGLELNRALYYEEGDNKNEIYDIICGTMLITGLGDGTFESLSDDLAKKYREKFKYPEKFVRLFPDKEIRAIKTEREF